ncbi:hypothetical protein C2845_PM02G17320 [Panicum miliaceum]|uniref:RNase H type-1 domain-containing protein n=1 Tax=Panicum miliaceum TaxID=4540 RepID=A0A3L6SDX4_PANMI|nr:hypothetical protein C2845_PM02G17320 [Panicum miliaceum]
MVQELICLGTKADTLARVPGRWTRLHEHWVKVNTDASFLASSSSGAGGVIIRDSEGRLLSVAARRCEHVPDVLTGEALAVRDGLVLVGEQGHENVILETDNLPLVNLLRSDAGVEV